MADDENLVPDIDVTTPSTARVYDYWLGGKDNFAVDREMAGRMAAVNPAMPQLVRANREFLRAAVIRAASAGVGQFLDLGSGLPSHPAVHEAARQVNPDARVCYVDIDPVAATHGAALLARGEGLAAVRADLTDPGTLLTRPEVRAVLDLGQPTAVILGAVLHFMRSADAARVCAAYMSGLPRGSWLIVSTGHYDDAVLAKRLQEAATHARFWNHDVADVASWLTGLDPVPPGVSEGSRWIAGTGGVPDGLAAYPLVGAGVKTA